MGTALRDVQEVDGQSEAKDRDGWLGLFADDAMVEDPVGPSCSMPGQGHHGIEAITDFYDNVISQSENINFTVRRSPSSAATRSQHR